MIVRRHISNSLFHNFCASDGFTITCICKHSNESELALLRSLIRS
jgi:hypothetical protein